MGKPPNWAERTDPGYSDNADRTIVGPAPVRPGPEDDDDEIEELSSDEALGQAPAGPRPTHGGGGTASPEKTVVAAVLPPPPAAPSAPPSADKTMIIQAPSAAGPASAEATMITANPLAAPGQKPLRGRLTITEGKEIGRVLEMRDGTQIVGRSRDCEIILLDIQVSRQHAQLVADRNGVLVRDLGSGNGTQVNGADVTEVRLVHGDELRIGDHIMHFEEEGPVADVLPSLSRGGRSGPPAVAPPPGMAGGLPAVPGPPGLPSVAGRRAKRRGGADPKKKLIIFGSIGGGLVLLMAIIKLMIPSAPPEPEGPTPAEVAQQLYGDGLALFKSGKYRDALAQFEAAAANAPANEEISRYLTAAKREVQADDAIQRGEDAVARSDWDEARRAFRSVDPESLRQKDADAGLQRVDEGQARFFTDKGDAILFETEDIKIDDCEDARSHYQEALAVLSDYQPALTGISRADEKIDEIRKQKNESAAARAARIRRERLAAAARAKNARQAALRRCAKEFDGGNFRRADACFADLAAGGGDPQLRKAAKARVAALKKFPAAYDRGMGAAKSRQAADAIKFLGIAERGARKVSKGGAIHGKINKELADMHYLEGRVAFNGKNYCKAFDHWFRAVSAQSSHKYASDGLRDLEKIAHELYLDAYIKMRGINRAQAIRQFKQVLCMTRSSSEDHRKAKDRLADLGEG